MIATTIAALLCAAPIQETPPDIPALYQEHCARCHGENGDGKGTTELERPARSFLLGGYSYGNTRNAVVRSVTHGIPGTPMPAFGETLDAAAIEGLAQFVIGLGPEGTVVEAGENVLAVGDAPLVVHGMMPPAYDGGRIEPRSLVIGFPNGTTFQYRVEDGHLVAIRQGDFLERVDWTNRGGQALKPLGAVTWTGAKDGSTDPKFVKDGDENAAALSRRIVGTRVVGESVWLRFDLLGDDGKVVGGGHEVLSFLKVDDVPVATRAVVGVGGVEAVRTRPKPWDEIAEPLVVAPEGEGEAPPPHRAYRVTDGLLALDPASRTDTRVFLHAAGWTESLRATVLDSLTKKED